MTNCWPILTHLILLDSGYMHMRILTCACIRIFAHICANMHIYAICIQALIEHIWKITGSTVSKNSAQWAQCTRNRFRIHSLLSDRQSKKLAGTPGTPPSECMASGQSEWWPVFLVDSSLLQHRCETVSPSHPTTCHICSKKGQYGSPIICLDANKHLCSTVSSKILCLSSWTLISIFWICWVLLTQVYPTP